MLSGTGQIINGSVFDKVFKPSIFDKVFKIMKILKVKEVSYVSPLIRAVELRGSRMLCISLQGNTGTESLSGGTEIIISGSDQNNNDWSF